MSNQLYPPRMVYCQTCGISVSVPGKIRSILDRCCSECYQKHRGSKFYVESAMTERPKQNETPEQKPDEQPKLGMSVSPTGGFRANKGKYRFSRIHRSVVSAFAEVTDKSSVECGGKYPDNNYKNGLGQTSLADSGLRHLFEYLAGRNIDPESGIHHLKHALWNFIVMVEQLETHPELDDRFHKESK